MVKSKGGKKEMLAFDQGLSFPDGNDKYTMRDFGNQRDFLMDAGQFPLTDGFIDKFGSFLDSGDFDKLTTYIKDNIGDKESAAFAERVGFFANEIFNKEKDTIKDMGFLRRRWKT